MTGRLRIMPETLAKAWAGILTFLLSVHYQTPRQIRVMVPMLIAFIAVDTATGVWLAAVHGRVRSKRMTYYLMAKLLQYGSILVVFSFLGLLGSTWSPVLAGLGACCAIETVSIFENLNLIERQGGANLGLIRPLLRNVNKYLEVETGETIVKASISEDKQQGEKVD